MTRIGLIHDFSGQAIAWVFLGMAEEVLPPGVNYSFSARYKRSELGI